MQKPTLAIVIPAYKHQFLRETLESIAGQTCKDFNLYIGDDGSPNPIKEIVEEFRGRLDFTYHRFEENLGSKSLVGHWKRCIEMTQGEEWLMILGDDDVFSENLVEFFFKNLNEIIFNKISVVRFATIPINEFGKPTSPVFLNPKFEKAPDSFIRKMEGKTRSSLSEYVFFKKAFEKNGFRDFPLAWYSDDYAWLTFSGFSSIFSINEATCKIRTSEQSLSGSSQNIDQKIKAKRKFFRVLISKHLGEFSESYQKQLLLRFEFFIFSLKQFSFREWYILFLGLTRKFSLIRGLKFSKNYLLSFLTGGNFRF